ncbi:MAG: hypothetical protein ACREJC_03990 [Tepidisphaeraceae bacterium]
MKIYVAAASSEIERAEKWIAALREAGFEVVSTWPEVIRQVGQANPMQASREDRAGWAAEDLSQVATAEVFWFLLGKPTAGAYTEFGYALFLGAMSQEARLAGVNAPIYRLLTSGTETSIFTALAIHFETDEKAFEALKVQLNFERMAQKNKSPGVSSEASSQQLPSEGG